MRLLGFIAGLAGLLALAFAFIFSLDGDYAGGVLLLLFSGVCFLVSGILWEGPGRARGRRSEDG